MPAQIYAENVWRYHGRHLGDRRAVPGARRPGARRRDRRRRDPRQEPGDDRGVHRLDRRARLHPAHARAPEAQRGGLGGVRLRRRRRRLPRAQPPTVLLRSPARVGIRIAPHFYTKREEIDLFFGELKRLRQAAGADARPIRGGGAGGARPGSRAPAPGARRPGRRGRPTGSCSSWRCRRRSRRAARRRCRGW